MESNSVNSDVDTEKEQAANMVRLGVPSGPAPEYDPTAQADYVEMSKEGEGPISRSFELDWRVMGSEKMVQAFQSRMHQLQVCWEDLQCQETSGGEWQVKKVQVGA